jgi:hypothetical protein
MAHAESALEPQARRAYEVGRLAWALKRALIVAAATGVVLQSCADLGATTLAVAPLAVLVTGLLWRGRDCADGVRPGLMAGLAPFVLPLWSQSTGYFCSLTVCVVLPAVCVAGGVVGGAVLGVQGRRPFGTHAGFWVSAVLVTALLGSAGCLVVGLAGIAGMALGLCLGVAPVLVARTA